MGWCHGAFGGDVDVEMMMMVLDSYDEHLRHYRDYDEKDSRGGYAY